MAPSPTATDVSSASVPQEASSKSGKMSETGSQERFLKEIFVDDDSELIVSETAADEASKDGAADDEFDVGTMDKLSQDPPTPKKKSRKSATPKKVDVEGSAAPATPSKKAQLQALKEKKEAAEKKDREEAQAFADGLESSDMPLPESEDAEDAGSDAADVPATRPAEEEKQPVKKVAKVVKRRPGLTKKKAVPSTGDKAAADGKEKAKKAKASPKDSVSDEFSGLSLAELKAACKERSLPVTGNKTALLGHLRGTSEASKKKNSPKAASKAKAKPAKVKGDAKSPAKAGAKAKSPKTPVSKKRKAEGASPDAPAAKKQRRSPAAQTVVKKKKAAKKKSGRPTIVLSGMDFDMKDIAASMCKDLGTYACSDDIDENCQLLVVGSKDSRTVKLFLAMVMGAMVVKHNWLMDSLEEGMWKDPGMYEAVDWFPGCKTAREIRKQKGLDLLQGESIHVEKPYLPIAVLGELILSLGGQVTHLRKATLCLSRTKLAASANENNIPVATERWLIDSLLAYKLQDKADYVPDEDADAEEPEAAGDADEAEEAESDDEESDDEFDAAGAEEEEDDDEEMADAEEDDA